MFKETPLCYITSDLHLDHKNAINFNSRPFSTLEEMQDKLIEEINALPEGSTLYILGDVVVAKSKARVLPILERIKTKVIVVLGNHDEHTTKIYDLLGIEYVPYLSIHHDNRRIVMCHYPMQEWHNGHIGSLHFYGHVHGMFDNHGKSLDVTWDKHNRILRLDEAMEMADEKPIYQPCHSSNNGVVDVSLIDRSKS